MSAHGFRPGVDLEIDRVAPLSGAHVIPRRASTFNGSQGISEFRGCYCVVIVVITL